MQPASPRTLPTARGASVHFCGHLLLGRGLVFSRAAVATLQPPARRSEQPNSPNMQKGIITLPFLTGLFCSVLFRSGGPRRAASKRGKQRSAASKQAS
ncbi:hypothetical protein BD289DRAFT_68260 [Coniella lustricola]|uniref:Uncharacterized protein n=1 Tax=Coniella lustricola TaxID=2025994 RepID=A0A2T3A0A2_9PEZI|nr:hypothetical protein BD289DRAFT_68260 [Coniella lustricola]